MKELNFGSMFDSKKLMNRFFRKVDNVVWDLSTGKIGIATEEGINTIEGEGDDAQIVLNMFDQFGMPIPAYAQNTPVESVQLGDLIYGKTITGWVTAKTGKSFQLVKVDGTRTTWSPPKVQMMGLEGVNGVMVLRSLINMLPGGSTGLSGMQGMLMPMMMMGGDNMDLESIMPMMLMSQMGNNTLDAEGNAVPSNGMDMSSMMPMMMMMSMMKGGNSSNSTSFPFNNTGINYFDGGNRNG